jgi:hypothetical protein
MVDNPESKLSLQERLAILRARNNRWATLDWHKRITLNIPFKGGDYEIIGGIFARSMLTPNSPSNHLFATRLPSAYDDGGQLMKDLVGLRLVDFALDPSQDLIVFYDHDPHKYASFHCSLYGQMN